MMILRVLGAVDLRDNDGAECSRILRQPKRAALLAYLALASPPGQWHRRDRLLGVFWPELDDAHARGSLNSSLNFIRRSLGGEPILSRGAEEVALARESFDVDVWHFREAVKAGRLEEALDLYSGDLLDGLFLSDVPEFERWLDNARRELRQEAAVSTAALADRYSSGDPAAAIAWAQRALALVPDDEAAVRRLIALQASAGNHAAALRTYADFERRLRTEFESEPARETRALLVSLREQHAGRHDVAEPRARMPVPDRPQDELPASPEPLGRRDAVASPHSRALSVGISSGVLVALVAAAIGVAFWSRGNVRASARDETIAVSILPFEFTGASGSEYLAAGATILLGNALDGAGPLRVIDQHALPMQADAEARPTRLARGRERARAGGAGRIILGEAVLAGDELTLSAALFDTSDSGVPLSRATVTGGPEALSTMVPRLARGLLEVLYGETTWLNDLATIHTESFPALKEYLRAEHYMRRSWYDSAAFAYRAAVAEDSAFARAWLGLADAENFAYSGPMADARMVEAIDNAIRHAHRLTPRDRLLAMVTHAEYHGDGAEGERRALEFVGRYPSSPLGWLKLGGIQWWHAWHSGLSYSRAEFALERAQALDPDNARILHMLGAIALAQNRRERGDSLMRRAWPRGTLLRLPSDAVARPRFWQQLRDATRGRIVASVLNNAAFSDSLDAAHRMARLLTDVQRRDPLSRSYGHTLEGFVEIARGRWWSADSAFERADRMVPGTGVLERAWIATLPFLAIDSVQLHARREALRQWVPPEEYLVWTEGANWPRHLFTLPWLVPHVRTYVLGLLSARLGDEDESLRHASRLAGASEPNDSIGLLRDLALEIQAFQAQRRGEHERAVAILDGAELRIAAHYQVLDSPLHMRPLTRYLRAEALMALEQFEEAEGWYRGFGNFYNSLEFVFTTPVMFRLGQLEDRRGNVERARYYYDRFVTRWERADPAQRACVDAARARTEEMIERRGRAAKSGEAAISCATMGSQR